MFSSLSPRAPLVNLAPKIIISRSLLRRFATITFFRFLSPAPMNELYFLLYCMLIIFAKNWTDNVVTLAIIVFSHSLMLFIVSEEFSCFFSHLCA